MACCLEAPLLAPRPQGSPEISTTMAPMWGSCIICFGLGMLLGRLQTIGLGLVVQLLAYPRTRVKLYTNPCVRSMICPPALPPCRRFQNAYMSCLHPQAECHTKTYIDQFHIQYVKDPSKIKSKRRWGTHDDFTQGLPSATDGHCWGRWWRHWSLIYWDIAYLRHKSKRGHGSMKKLQHSIGYMSYRWWHPFWY